MSDMKLSKKAAATRQHILDTSRGLILRKGFSGVGLQEILKNCDVPKGSFYHYFPSKEAFGRALLQQYVDDYHERLEVLLTAHEGSGRERLMRYWNAWIDDPISGSWAEQCLVVKLAAEVADLSEDMRQVLNDGVEHLVTRIAVVITEGRADGSLPPGAVPQVLAKVLYQMWLGAALLAKLGQDKEPLHQAFTATDQLLTCVGNNTGQES